MVELSDCFFFMHKPGGGSGGLRGMVCIIAEFAEMGFCLPLVVAKAGEGIFFWNLVFRSFW